MSEEKPRRLGRYLVHRQIGVGGMAAVHLGKLAGPAGFSRAVAIKRLHPELARDPRFVAMFLDEARIAARVRHPNIVATLDVVSQKGELFLVMDFVDGASLATLLSESAKRGQPVDIAIACAVVSSALGGLHAAHECVGENQKPLMIIHRDVSPQNVLVGIDGIPRVADFGVAKAVGRLRSTTGGAIKGKLGYLAPEVIHGDGIDRRVDVFASAVVLWETLVGRRLFAGSEATIVHCILNRDVEPPSAHRRDIPAALDEAVARGLRRDPAERFGTAEEMALAIERAHPLASPRAIAAWVRGLAASDLARRASMLEELDACDDAPPLSASRGSRSRPVKDDADTVIESDLTTKKR